MPPNESRRAEDPTCRAIGFSTPMNVYNIYDSTPWWWIKTSSLWHGTDGQTDRQETLTAANRHDPNLCLGTVKSARTNFLLFDLVFMFMQKSIAAYKTDDYQRSFNHAIVTDDCY